MCIRALDGERAPLTTAVAGAGPAAFGLFPPADLSIHSGRPPPEACDIKHADSLQRKTAQNMSSFPPRGGGLAHPRRRVAVPGLPAKSAGGLWGQ